jgi:hypothetical protein
MGDGDLSAAAERLVAGLHLVIDQMPFEQRERVIEAIRGVAPGVAERLEAPSSGNH